jgi:hypothetical protein
VFYALLEAVAGVLVLTAVLPVLVALLQALLKQGVVTEVLVVE